MTAKMCMTHFDEVVLIDPEFNKVLTGKSKSRVMQLRSVHGEHTCHLPSRVLLLI